MKCVEQLQRDRSSPHCAFSTLLPSQACIHTQKYPTVWGKVHEGDQQHAWGDKKCEVNVDVVLTLANSITFTNLRGAEYVCTERTTNLIVSMYSVTFQ